MDKKELGKRIAKMRKKCGLTQNELAKMTETRQTHISRIETGVYMPRLEMLVKIAKALNCDIEELLK